MRSEPTKCRPIRRRLILWLFGSLFGALVIAMPDSGPRLFSFSPSHGPSAIDMLGVLIMAGAWLPVAMLVWEGRASLHPKWAMLAGGLATAGATSLALALAADMAKGWMAGAALLILAQLLAVAAMGTTPARR